MQPADLHEQSFSHYPAQARALAISSLDVLNRVPLSLLPLFLSQLIKFDWLFPPEQRDLTSQLHYLASLSPTQFDALMQPFVDIRISPQLATIDWVNQPRHFSEQLSAYLWTVHEIDDYHRAVQAYQNQIDSNRAKEAPQIARLTMVVIGAGVHDKNVSVFRRLAPHGTLFTAVDPGTAWQTLASTLHARAQQFPLEHAHWYIDGGDPAAGMTDAPGINLVSFERLAPAVRKELSLMNDYRLQPPASSTTNVEAATYYLADIGPGDLGLGGSANATLRRFEAQVLTEGAGTQVYSTTFVQWSARECLHRAQPLTLLVRFRPRQQAAPMNELLARDPFTQKTDPLGALVDADMGAYYTWINQGRLPGADQSLFLAWFEGHSTAIAIGPATAKGAISDTPTDLSKVLSWMS